MRINKKEWNCVKASSGPTRFRADLYWARQMRLVQTEIMPSRQGKRQGKRRIQMNREVLEKEFDRSQIKQRKGNYGRMLDYVDTPAVIRRLNDATEGDWSFEIVSHQILENEVAVLGKLSVFNGSNGAPVVKMQFGSKELTKDKGTGEAYAIGDDLKSAASDALKKAATLLGVALHLYGDEPIASAPEEPATNKADANNRITREQLLKLNELRLKLKHTPEQLQGISKTLFKTNNVRSLNRTQADGFIKNLEKKLAEAQSASKSSNSPSSSDEDIPF